MTEKISADYFKNTLARIFQSGYKQIISMKVVLFILSIAIPALCFSQHESPEGEIIIIADPRIESLAEEYPQVAGQIHSIEGFRIQIFFDSGNLSKRNASQVREDFIKQFPGTEAYITFREPYYRVRVGDFRTKLEADGFRKRILKHYPHAFTVNDQIKPSGSD